MAHGERAERIGHGGEETWSKRSSAAHCDMWPTNRKDFKVVTHRWERRVEKKQDIQERVEEFELPCMGAEECPCANESKC